MDYRQEIIGYLAKHEGLVLTPIRSGDEYVVHSVWRDAFRYSPVFTLPADLLSEYLHQCGREFPNHPDPLGEAVSMTQIHAAEYLGTDHGDGLNATVALGFRRTRAGKVEFFLDQDV